MLHLKQGVNLEKMGRLESQTMHQCNRELQLSPEFYQVFGWRQQEASPLARKEKLLKSGRIPPAAVVGTGY